MFCHDCRIHASGEKRGPFVIGTQNFKLESIREHEKSQADMKCARIASAKKAPPNTSIAEKTLSSLNRAQSEKWISFSYNTCNCEERKAIYRLCLDVRS